MTPDQIIEKLNPVQKEAVITTEGPLLIIAGAGSGKTRVLTSRVAYILARRLAQPFNIMAVTFTNKAANEMKERIAGLLGETPQALTVSTFHSFCARLLRHEASAIGYPSNFSIFDEDDAIALIRTCIDDLKFNRNQFTPSSLKHKISAAKNRMEDADAFAAKASGYFETRTAEIYLRYSERLRQCAAFDFDDLIFQSVRLLETSENIRRKYQERFKYILVDEYQDTNHSQYKLLRHLVGPEQNICVVGDEDQSIYGWRGADISNILNFEADFPGARVIKLEQNYRSTEVILQAASTVIANNLDRKGKTLWTEQKSGDLLRLFFTDSSHDEAMAVVGEIESSLNRTPLKETVILYRTNAQSRAFEEILKQKSIPYQIIGGISFYQRREIKDLVAYLKLLVNSKDDISFLRIINYPRRGLGESSLNKLSELASSKGSSLYETALEIETFDDFPARPKAAIAKFVGTIEKYRELKSSAVVADLIQALIDEIRLVEALLEEDPLLAENRIENINEFVAGAREFARAAAEPSLDSFLSEISLYTDIDEYNDIDDKLTLMTLHAAKGLEFEAVFIVGLEEGLFPLGRSLENAKDLEEERRLFYVGATRAKKHLYLTMAEERNRYGMMQTIPSRFIKELPSELLVVDDRRRGRGGSQTWEDAASGAGAAGERRYEYESDEYSLAGRIVQHPAFGRGKVLRVEGAGENLRLDIHFSGVGLKKIMAKYAKLKVVG